MKKTNRQKIKLKIENVKETNLISIGFDLMSIFQKT